MIFIELHNKLESLSFFLYFHHLFFDQVRDRVGDVTMVINNAGVVSGKSLLDLDDVSIQRTFDVNIIAHF
jgi:short-subunit dehydrogenase